MQKDYLEKAFDVMSRQKEFYKSSKFWEEACKKISKNTIESDFKDFRRDSDNLNFFVPTYGYPGNGFSKEAIKEILNLFSEHKSSKNLLAQKHFLSGETHFFSDYRVLKAANKKEDILDISQFCESSFGNPIEHFQAEGKLFSRSSMNYLLGISYLKSLLPNFIPESVLEIGGGFGTLGEILYQIPEHKIRYIDIDLPPIFLIAFKYLKNACNLKKEDYFLSNLNDKQEVINISDLPSFSFFPDLGD